MVLIQKQKVSDKKFLKADSSNKLIATQEENRKCEVGLAVLGKFICCAKQLPQANILYRKLMEKKTKYSNFEINKMSFDKKNWPSISLE